MSDWCRGHMCDTENPHKIVEGVVSVVGKYSGRPGRLVSSHEDDPEAPLELSGSLSSHPKVLGVYIGPPVSDSGVSPQKVEILVEGVAHHVSVGSYNVYAGDLLSPDWLGRVIPVQLTDEIDPGGICALCLQNAESYETTSILLIKKHIEERDQDVQK